MNAHTEDVNEVLAENIRIETMGLHFKPIYAFEYQGAQK